VDYLDYRMSEKFGLDWWKEDARRIAKFIAIIQYESEQSKKGSDEPKFRPRM